MTRPTPADQRIDDATLGLIVARVASRLGLSIPPRRWGELRKSLLSLATEFGHSAPLDFAGRLLAPRVPDGLLQALASQVTVGETYFFRDKPLLAALEQHVLAPLVAERRAGSRRLRLMSAGCATGEEAYTLAMLLRRLLPDRTGWEATVLGVDVNERSLDKARAGVYSAWSFRRVDERLREAYFLREGDRRWRVRPELRAMVAFLRLNLAEDTYPSRLNGTADMDLVLCRNVLMYFVPEVAAAVVGRLRDCLAPGGFLVLAASETVLAQVPGLAPTGHVGILVKTKAASGPPTVLTATALQPKSPTPSRAFTQPPAPQPDGQALAGVVAVTTPREVSAPPPPATASLRTARNLYAAGHYAAAAEEAERIVQSPGLAESNDWTRAVGILVRALANQNEYGRADQALLQAIARDKLNPALRHLRASILLEEGRPERRGEAKEELRRALYLEPGLALAHFLLGNIAKAEGRADTARRHFANARAIVGGLNPDQVLEEADGMSAGGLALVLDTIATQEARHEP